MIRGINALRCMVAALGENFWNLLAAGYWGASFIGMGSMAEMYLNMANAHVCTCAADAEGFV